jgi:hypothetical protein
MIKGFNFKDNQILKLITVVTLLYSVLMVTIYLGQLSDIVFKVKNPLIPEYLIYYIAFPALIILPFFLVIIFICIRSLKKGDFYFKSVYTLLGIVFLFFIFQSKVYKFLMDINPYAS